MTDDEAEEFSAFVNARSASLFRTAVLLTGSRERADDLVQSSLERLWRHWSRARVADSPDAYARRVLVNLANDRWRGTAWRRTTPLDEEQREPTDPYAVVDQRDLLIRGLHTLPVNMRTVLVLRYYDDLPDEGIADLMNISTSTVRSQASRGLAKLRSAVGRPTDEGAPHARVH